jgi:hypothetical protein
MSPPLPDGDLMETYEPHEPQASHEPNLGDTTHSPIRLFVTGSLLFAMLSAGFMAAYVPRPAPPGWSTGFLVASAVLLVAAVAGMLGRRNFAWSRFFVVAKYVVLMTVVISAMLEYVFVYDGMRGNPLAIMSVVLAITAIDVPILWGFAVARHETAPGRS